MNSETPKPSKPNSVEYPIDKRTVQHNARRKRRRQTLRGDKKTRNGKKIEQKGSGNYADMLSEYPNKGKCGAKEIFEAKEVVEAKIKQLAEYFRESSHTVVYTGAGISTAAGIPDFRGPKGVWTLEKKGEPAPSGLAWEDTKPTLTHKAINLLEKKGLIHCLVSQNVDGLHLRSGFPRDKLCELHGNIFMEKCDRCGFEYMRKDAIPSVGLKSTGRRCTQSRTSCGREVGCRGRLRDTTLDWEDMLPDPDFTRANQHSQKATLALTLGTSLQINPAGRMPLEALKNPNGKLVIVNLQHTPHDEDASVVIHAYVDHVMEGLLKELGLPKPD
ncbi:hypothetical protein AAMO2058_001594700 [Amorphochlora amoebiformis]